MLWMSHCWIERQARGGAKEVLVLHITSGCVCVCLCVCVCQRVTWWGKSLPSVLNESREDGAAKSGVEAA